MPQGQMPETMQAIRFHQYGGPEVLQLEQIPRPQPAADEILVKVYAAGVQPYDWKLRSGWLKDYRPVSLPYIPGTPFAGLIEEIGADISGFEKGQSVFGRSEKGTYAEYTLVKTNGLALKPAGLSFEQAATLPAGATTAWLALFENAVLEAGQQILVLGGAGGVGNYAIQLARWKGASVATTTSTANLDFVSALGANLVIDYSAGPFEEAVRQKMGSVDFVLDTVGGEMLERSVEVIKPGGTLVSIVGQPSAEKLQAKNIRLISNNQPPTQATLENVARLVEACQLQVTVGQVFALSQARQAHELSQTGHGRGRIVLQTQNN